ncbi:MAG: ATP-binding protein, partial [Gammaproteobacteria bacterium]|nr:ATP-binding protein [Gammaproteobacteria bacterium]
MNPLTNPFAPGAGTPPPELAGRDSVLAVADIAIQRNKACRPARSLMLVGLRGVGKTVLLSKMVEIAEKHGAISSFFEVGTNGPLAHTVITTLRAALLRLDNGGISGSVKRGLRVLKSFAATVRIRYGDFDISIPDLDMEAGTADSGVLAHDLADLFVAVGEAARAQKTSVVILIDEIQNLVKEEIGSLIMAIHHTDRQQLPILVIGAGLPSMIRLSSETKSYAERLFEYSDVGPLDETASRRALTEPARRAGVVFDDKVIAAVKEQTRGYP